MTCTRTRMMGGLLRILRSVAVSLSLTALILGIFIHLGRFVHAAQTPPPSVRNIKLGEARPGKLYALTLGVKDPVQLQGNDAVLVTVKDARGEVESKWLHSADLDYYLTLSPRAAGPVTVELSADSSVHVPEISATMNKILQAPLLEPGKAADLQLGVIAAAPNDTWQNAQPFEVGQTIYGSG